MVRGTMHRLHISGGGFWIRLNPSSRCLRLGDVPSGQGLTVIAVILSRRGAGMGETLTGRLPGQELRGPHLIPHQVVSGSRAR
jgi:hypothetical protein